MSYKLFLIGLLASYFSCVSGQHPCYYQTYPSYYCSQYIPTYQAPQSNTYVSYYNSIEPNTYTSYYQQNPESTNYLPYYFYYYSYYQNKPLLGNNTTQPVASSAVLTNVTNLIDVYTIMFVAMMIDIILNGLEV